MEIASLAIVGAFVSVLVQAIKKVSKSSPNGTRLIVIALSVVAGVLYQVFGQTEYWEAGLTVLATASTVYLYFIKPVFEEPSQQVDYE